MTYEKLHRALKIDQHNSNIEFRKFYLKSEKHYEFVVICGKMSTEAEAWQNGSRDQV